MFNGNEREEIVEESFFGKREGCGIKVYSINIGIGFTGFLFLGVEVMYEYTFLYFVESIR